MFKVVEEKKKIGVSMRAFVHHPSICIVSATKILREAKVMFDDPR